MSVVAVPPRTLVEAWGGLVALGAATSLLAAVVGPPPIPTLAAALVLALAWLKARLILRRYLCLEAAPSWRGGFDVPFLRTRYAHLGLPWPFADVAYADVMSVVADRFNTTVDGEEHRDLAGVYEVLCDGEYGAVDPFDGSEAAVAAFENGWFAELVLHNVADVLRTQALGRVAERYCSKSDFGVKSLTPTRAGE